MANADVEKATYGAFERFLYIFFIPLMFTLILTGVLLSLFGYDVKETLLRVGHSIPIVGSVVPAPAPTLPTDSAVAPDDAGDMEAMQASLQEKESELLRLKEEAKLKDQAIQDLRNELEQARNEFVEKTQTSEEYRAQLQHLADIYTNMTPSKAAPILEQLAMPELVLVLSQMKSDALSNILSKMTPQIAAEASIQMKDMIPLEDQAMAALQARLEINQQDDAARAKLSASDLAQTFAGMAPRNAADVLQAMMATDQVQVVEILSVMNVQPRSQILAAISESSKENAAKISSILGK